MSSQVQEPKTPDGQVNHGPGNSGPDKLIRNMIVGVLALVSVLCIVGIWALVVFIQGQKDSSEAFADSKTIEAVADPETGSVEDSNEPNPIQIDVKYDDSEVERGSRQMKMLGAYALKSLGERLKDWIDHNWYDPKLLSDRYELVSLSDKGRNSKYSRARSEDRAELGQYLSMGDPIRRSLYSMYVKFFRGGYVEGETLHFGNAKFRIGDDLPPGMRAVQVIDKERFSVLEAGAMIFVEHEKLSQWHEEGRGNCQRIRLPIHLQMDPEFLPELNITADEEVRGRVLLHCRAQKKTATVDILGGHEDIYQLITNCADHDGTHGGYYLWPERDHYKNDGAPSYWELKYLTCENFEYERKRRDGRKVKVENILLLNTFRFGDFMDPS